MVAVPQIAAYAASWLGAMGIVWVFFERVETMIKPEVKHSISMWLISRKVASRKEWPVYLEVLFRRIFGEEHFSIRCFVYSMLASIGSVIILTLLWAALNPSDAVVFLKNKDMIIAVLLMGTIFNVIPDYLSLYETRVILRWMVSSNFSNALLLIADFVLTTIIISFVISLFVVIAGADFVFPRFGWLIELFHSGYLMRNATDEGIISIGVFIYSTYLTSFWIWLFLFSSFIARVLIYANRFIGELDNVFDVENRPLQVLGFISMIVVSVLYSIAIPIAIYV